MSNIGDFIALLGAATVSFTAASGDSIALTAYYDSSLKNSVQASGTPCRLLLIFTDRDEMAFEVSEFQIGNVAPVRWRIHDQMLWRPVGFGQGYEDASADLHEYMAAYVTMVMSLDASSITDRMTTESVAGAAREIQFPDGSGNWYIGVDVTWTVVEDDPV